MRTEAEVRAQWARESEQKRQVICRAEEIIKNIARATQRSLDETREAIIEAYSSYECAYGGWKHALVAYLGFNLMESDRAALRTWAIDNTPH